MGVKWGSTWVHADHSTFPVPSRMHRKALGFLASGLIWIRWDPVGSHGRPVGIHVDPEMFPGPSIACREIRFAD